MKKSLVSLLLMLGMALAVYAQDDFVCGTDDRHFSVLQAAIKAWNTENRNGRKSTLPTIVPIVVGYDDAALSQEGSEAGVRNWVETNIELMNTGLTTSKAPAQVELVGLRLFPHGLSLTPPGIPSLYKLLSWVIANPEIAEFRDQEGGKLIFYATGLNPGGGMAGGLVSVGQMGRSIIAHEVGHSLGLHHDWYEDPSCAPACGYTFRDASGRWQGDFMAYSACNSLGLDPATCRETSYRDGFSNPDVLYEGVPTGIKNVADAARVIAENAPAIAAGLSPGECRDYETSICLQGGRFLVGASWRTADGSYGNGKAVRLTEDTAYFSFFSDANVELTVKVLNGCGLNGKFWVFAAGMTNVEVVLGVTDTKTGTHTSYANPLNKTFVTRTDTGAFDCTY